MLLQVPTALLLLDQDHNYKQAAPHTHQSPVKLHADTTNLQVPEMPSLPQSASKSLSSPHKTQIVLQLVSYTAFFTLGSLCLSDMQLRHYPEHFTTSLFTMPRQGATPLPLGTKGATHWVWHVYGYMLKVRHASICSLLINMCGKHQHFCFIA